MPAKWAAHKHTHTKRQQEMEMVRVCTECAIPVAFHFSADKSYVTCWASTTQGSHSMFNHKQQIYSKWLAIEASHFCPTFSSDSRRSEMFRAKSSFQRIFLSILFDSIFGFALEKKSKRNTMESAQWREFDVRSSLIFAILRMIFIKTFRFEYIYSIKRYLHRIKNNMKSLADEFTTWNHRSMRWKTIKRNSKTRKKCAERSSFRDNGKTLVEGDRKRRSQRFEFTFFHFIHLIYDAKTQATVDDAMIDTMRRGNLFREFFRDYFVHF